MAVSTGVPELDEVLEEEINELEEEINERQGVFLFRLNPGAEVPKYMNEVEHEQFVLAGEYTVGIDDREYEVSAGDSLLVPPGAVHWYRNDDGEPGAFLCVLRNGHENGNGKAEFRG